MFNFFTIILIIFIVILIFLFKKRKFKNAINKKKLYYKKALNNKYNIKEGSKNNRFFYKHDDKRYSNFHKKSIRDEMLKLFQGKTEEKLKALKIAEELSDKSILPILRKGLRDTSPEVVKISALLIRNFR